MKSAILIDQWISFESPKGKDGEDSSGKIKLKIIRKSSDQPRTGSLSSNFKGIGELFIRVDEVVQATSDNEKIEVDVSSITFSSGIAKNIFSNTEVDSVTVNKCCVLPITGAKNDIIVSVTSAINRKAVYTSTFSPLLGVKAGVKSTEKNDPLAPASGTHSLSHSLTQSLTHSLNHSLTHSLTHLPQWNYCYWRTIIAVVTNIRRC